MAVTFWSTIVLQTLLILSTTCALKQGREEGYLQYVKDGCFVKGEALSCMKYKALKLAKKTIFGDNFSNETIRANNMISFVPLDQETADEVEKDDEVTTLNEPRGLFSEWTELTKYIFKLVRDFFKTKGIRVDLPDGARTIEEDKEEGRGRRKKLALIVPFLTLLAAVKAKLLLIPILLSVLLIKKLLLAAAFLVPSLLNTLKSCKVHSHHPSYSFFGGSDVSDYSSDYGNNYAYSSGGGYAKDWASNRAYAMQKPRPSPSPAYITAPGVA